jgi:calcineurin-like phosphoesterase family protein
MDEALINNWNAIVKPTDEVWDLGDFSFGTYNQTVSILKRLNGKHNFIMGNHDKTITKNKHDLLSHGYFNSIQDYKEIKFNRKHLVLFHFGQRVWNRSHHSSIHLYGHSHGSLPPFGKSVDVGVDCKEITSEYRPVSFDEVVSYMDKRVFSAVDHHDGMRD